MKRLHVPAAGVDIVSDHACQACGADRRGRGMGQPGLCDQCEREARAAKSRALRKRAPFPQLPKAKP